MELLVNSLQCKHCNDIIVSQHRHDFVSCSCGKNFCDGGIDYIRRGSPGHYIDLSVYGDGSHEDRRTHLTWGQNFEKDMNRLPQTKWITIKDMTTDHIEAVLNGHAFGGGIVIETLKEELKRRK